MKTTDNLFITGKAGTGKSWQIRKHIEYAIENNIALAVTASTGIAARNIGGMTIQKFLGTGITNNIKDYEKSSNLYKTRNIKAFERINQYDELIIDEVSMIHYKYIDLIDYVLRKAKKNSLPFGGMRIIFVGDFLQLPAIKRFKGEVKWQAFRSKAWREADIKITYLRNVHRQHDDKFIEMLSRVRFGDTGPKIYSYFGQFNLTGDEHLDQLSTYVRLCGTNEQVDWYNHYYLHRLEGETYEFDASLNNTSTIQLDLRDRILADDLLQLKIGCRVIAIINDAKERYVNGSIGTVIAIKEDAITVKFDNGNIVEVKRNQWTFVSKQGRAYGSLKQFPLKLAYAMTVHKAQGMTIDKVVVNCNDIFEEGQLYVAMSRCKYKQGLLLDDFNPALNIKVNIDSLKYYNNELFELIDDEILFELELLD